MSKKNKKNDIATLREKLFLSQNFFSLLLGTSRIQLAFAENGIRKLPSDAENKFADLLSAIHNAKPQPEKNSREEDNKINQLKKARYEHFSKNYSLAAEIKSRRFITDSEKLKKLNASIPLLNYLSGNPEFIGIKNKKIFETHVRFVKKEAVKIETGLITLEYQIKIARLKGELNDKLSKRL